MSSVIGSVASGIQGALLLARGRADGIDRVESDHAAALRSFWAIPLCVPAVMCLKLLDWVANGIPARAPIVLGRYLLLFVVGWLLFAWVSHHLTGVLNKQSAWPRFIAVWSYCSVIENTMVAMGGLPGALGAPAIVDQFAQVVTFGWALWLEWFAIRLSLQVGPLTAMVVLAVDMGIGVTMAVLAALGS